MSDTETAAEKFERILSGRLPKALDAIRLLGNLTNKRDYEFTEAQAQAVVDELQAKVDELAAAFGLEAGHPPVPLSPAPAAAPAPREERDPSLTEIDGRPAKVREGDWDAMQLMRVGPRLGRALEAVTDGDTETARELLVDVLKT